MKQSPNIGGIGMAAIPKISNSKSSFGHFTTLPRRSKICPNFVVNIYYSKNLLQEGVGRGWWSMPCVTRPLCLVKSHTLDAA